MDRLCVVDATKQNIVAMMIVLLTVLGLVIAS